MNHNVKSILSVLSTALIAALAFGCSNSGEESPVTGTGDQTLQCGSSALHAATHDSCDAMDAKASPDDSGSSCFCMLGFAWDGSGCVALGDCQCKGEDCDKLSASQEECLQKHAACEPAPSFHCGSTAMFAKAHDACEAMAVKEVGANGDHCDCMLGYAWNGSECVGLGDCACEGADCDKLTKTIEECQQKHASCGGAPEYHCGLTAFPSKHETCSAMDAQGGNMCNCAPFGYKWNGSECEGVTCSCTGADCDSLAPTFEECQTQHQSCK